MENTTNTAQTTPFASAKDLAAHLRGRIKHAGIKARVRILPGTSNAVQVFVPKFGMRFSDEEQRTIRHIAVCNRLTLVRGLPIDVERMTDPYDMNFYMPE